MVNIEKISETAMTVITYSGMAKSCYMEALALAKQGKFAESDEKMNEGSTHFLEAHHGHADVLAEEMSKEEPQISLLIKIKEGNNYGSV